MKQLAIILLIFSATCLERYQPEYVSLLSIGQFGVESLLLQIKSLHEISLPRQVKAEEYFMPELNIKENTQSQTDQLVETLGHLAIESVNSGEMFFESVCLKEPIGDPLNTFLYQSHLDDPKLPEGMVEDAQATFCSDCGLANCAIVESENF